MLNVDLNAILAATYRDWGSTGEDHGMVAEYIPDSQTESDRFPVLGIAPGAGNLTAVTS